MSVSEIRAPHAAFAAEVGRIREVLERTTATRGRAVVIHGPDGTGQSDLATELIAALNRNTDGVVLEGACTEGPPGPYRPFQSILAGAASLSASELVGSLLAGGLDEPAPTPLRELLAQVRVRDVRLNHLESVRRILCEVSAARPLTVVVRDLHAADPDTLALVDYLLEDAAAGHGVAGIGSRASRRPLYVLTVCDDHPVGREVLDRLRQHDAVEPAVVGRLDESGLAALVAEPRIAEKLLRVTGGLPHRVRTLVQMLPDDLESLLRARTASLDPDAVTALRFASVFGRPIAPGALAVLSGVPRRVVEDLRAAGLLNDTDDGVELSDAFARGIPLGDVDADEFHRLHRRCAEHLEARVALTGDELLFERIVEHHLAAGQAEDAARYALPAARRLRASAALRRAVELLERCVRARPGASQELLAELVDLDVALGHYERALARCRELGGGGDLGIALDEARIHSLSGNLRAAESALETLTATALPADLAGHVRAELADVRLRRGDLDGAAALCAGADDEPAEWGLRLRHTLGKIAFWRGDWAAAESCYYDLLRELDPTHRRLRAMLLHNLGLVSLRTGHFDAASRWMQEALGIFGDLGEHFEAAVCRHNLGLAHEYAQRYGMALPLFERAIEVLERFGNQNNLTGAINSLGDVYLTLGELWRARKLLEYSLELAQHNGLDYYVAYNRLKLARVSFEEGDLDDASSHARAASSGFEEKGYRREHGDACLITAEIAVAAGVSPSAALEAVERSGDDEIMARGRVVRAATMVASEPSRAHSLALEAAEALQRLGQRDGVIAAYLVAGRAALQADQRPEARRLAEGAEVALAELRERVPSEHREAFDTKRLVTQVIELRDNARESSVVVAARPAVVSAPRGAVFRGMTGASEPMQRVFEMVERLSDCAAPILIVGESGTGKELVAEAIRAGSSRAEKPFVRVNAAAFAESLLETELFGHEKGAFTGAHARKLGAFEQADGGTLFLDEIGDISPKTQVSLLRVLQEREFHRVGGRRPINVDVRILCATNRNLEEMVADGRFRLDLYYRIKGVTIELPPLSERGDDIVLVAEAILKRLAAEHGRHLRLSEDAVALLRCYRWPGNVRELENVLRSVYFFAQDERITRHDLQTYTLLRDVDPDDLTEGRRYVSDDAPLADGFDLNDAKRELEIHCIKRALAQADGNITQAARLLGLKRPRLSQKIKEYGLKDR